MAVPQQSTIQQQLAAEQLPVSPVFGSSHYEAEQQSLKGTSGNSENLRNNIKCQPEKLSSFTGPHCQNTVKMPEKGSEAHKTHCRKASAQTFELCFDNEEHLKNLQKKQCNPEESLSYPGFLQLCHSFHEKYSVFHISNPPQVHSSSMQCIVDKSPDVTGKNQQQTASDVVDDVVGDELAVETSPTYCSSIDAAKNKAWVKHLTSLSHDSGGLPDIAKHTGSISAATHSSSGKSESDCGPTERNDGAMPEFQPVTCNVGLNQMVNSQSVVFQSSTSSSTSCSSLAEDRNVESEQVIPCIVSSNLSRDNIPQPKCNISDSVEGTEGTVSQDVNVAALSALLATKDEDLKEFDKDMKNLQLINKQLLEEKSILVLENQWLQKETKKAQEEKVKDESGAEHFAFNPNTPTVLQRQIEDLKSHIRDLQEANETVVNELSKADEEISQLRGEVVRLRVEYTDELRDARQERDYFKDKIYRLHSDPPQLTGKDNTSDLLEEIQHLRIESRKLRKNNHQLDEENHQMKEELWDLRQHQEWFFSGNLKEKKRNLEITKKGGVVSLARKVPLCKRQVVVLKKEALQELKCIAPSSQCRFEFAKLEEKNGRLKSNREVTSAPFDQTFQTWDDKDEERAENCLSPISLDSDNTEALIASCNNGIFIQASNSKINNIKDHLLDLDGLSDEDMPSLREINGDSLKHCSRSTPRKSSSSQAAVWRTFNRNNHPMRPALCKAVLPQRPFAPRSVADLKIGHVVKFSRPAGKISKGAVKYLGPLPGRHEVYLGVELEGNEVGKHDGIFEGVRYFICKTNKGVFVNFSKVIMAWE
ncbi:uncharacterized protein LOC103186410 [Callorhinchus milii]|uniref:uncharacterized protein LOC103186410 n=1 Tax=Callorhinchus milii TaxID=7868 RepID=UPI001C3F96BF|nr:uncharacterized protein LOC103186410 [Callorhinchus milii]